MYKKSVEIPQICQPCGNCLLPHKTGELSDACNICNNFPPKKMPMLQGLAKFVPGSSATCFFSQVDCWYECNLENDSRLIFLIYIDMLPCSQQQWHGLRRVGIQGCPWFHPGFCTMETSRCKHQVIQLPKLSKTQLANLFFHCSDFVLPPTLVLEISVFNFLKLNLRLVWGKTNKHLVLFSNGTKYGNTTTQHIGSFGACQSLLGPFGPFGIAQRIYEINDCIHSYSFSWFRGIFKICLLLILP